MLLLTAVILLEPHGAGTKYTAIAIHGDEEGANSTRAWASTTIGAKADQLVTLAKKNARVRVGLTTILIVGKSGAPTTGNQHYRGPPAKASDVVQKIAAVASRHTSAQLTPRPGRRLHLDKSASAPLRVGENSEVGPWAANTATQHLRRS